MKTTVTALALVLFAGTAHAQATAGGRDALCYTYNRQESPGIWKLVKPVLREALNEREVPRKQWGAVDDCVIGIISALTPDVREICAAAVDPSDAIAVAYSDDVEACILESAGKPTAVFPDFSTPVDVPVDPAAAPEGKSAEKAAPKRRGLILR